MSAGEKAFGVIKAVFTMKDQLDDLGKDVEGLSDRFVRLAEAHAELRDRVSRVEGVLEGAAMASRRRRLEE
jgi:hypothetical protein